MIVEGPRRITVSSWRTTCPQPTKEHQHSGTNDHTPRATANKQQLSPNIERTKFSPAPDAFLRAVDYGGVATKLSVWLCPWSVMMCQIPQITESVKARSMVHVLSLQCCDLDERQSTFSTCVGANRSELVFAAEVVRSREDCRASVQSGNESCAVLFLCYTNNLCG